MTKNIGRVFRPLLVFVLLVCTARTVSAEASAPQAGGGKAVWEPLNYPKDLEFDDVFFIDASNGWIAGSGGHGGGFIMHTTDGGTTWTTQAGDPEAVDRKFYRLRFVDATHGWAVQPTGMDANLFATRDGQQWDLVGHIPEHFTDYQFVSASDGYLLSGTKILITRDGGSTWSEVFTASAQVEVGGLTRAVTCDLQALSFSTPMNGVAIGHSYDASNVTFVFRTEDGGATWASFSAAIGSPKEAVVKFLDPSTGILQFRDGRIFRTANGGEDWRGVPGSGGRLLGFADPEVGWSFSYRKMGYTTDGGNRWTSREFSFPASVEAFSLPRRDVGYVVGEHGMIYRYRSAAAGPLSPKAIPAPPVPPASSDAEPAASQLSSEVATVSESIKSQTDAGTTASVTTTVAAAAMAVPFIDKCCKAQLTKISDLVQSLVKSVPQLVGTYRNLNLVTLGLKLMTELPSELDGITSALAGLRKAQDAQSALTAAADLAAAVDAFKTSLTSESLVANNSTGQ